MISTMRQVSNPRLETLGQVREELKRFWEKYNALEAEVADLRAHEGVSWTWFNNASGSVFPSGTLFAFNAGDVALAIATGHATRAWGVSIDENGGANYAQFKGATSHPRVKIRTVGDGTIGRDDPLYLSDDTAGCVQGDEPNDNGDFCQLIGYALEPERDGFVWGRLMPAPGYSVVHERGANPGSGDPVLVHDGTNGNIRRSIVGIDDSGNISTTGTLGILQPYVVGDILYASTTSALAKLAVGASAGMFLRSTGTLPAWSTLILPNAATANRVVYASATNTYGESGNLTFDGSVLTVTGNDSVSGFSTIGGSVNTARVLNIAKTFANPTATNYGLFSAPTTTFTANNANIVIGIQSQSIVNQGGFNGTATRGVQGANFLADASGSSGTMTGAAGVVSNARNTGAGTLTNLYGIYVPAGINSGGGAVTNAYGLYLEAQTVGGTLNFSMYAAGAVKIDGVLRVGTGSAGTATGDGDLYVTDDLEVDDFASIGALAVGSDTDPGPTNATIAGTLEVTGDVTLSAALTGQTGDFASNVGVAALYGQGTSPSIAAGTGAGTSPTITLTGNDLSGIIEVVAGTTPAANAVIATITTDTTFANGISVILMPRNDNARDFAGGAGGGMIFAIGTSTTTWTFNSNTTGLTAGATYQWNYIAVGY